MKIKFRRFLVAFTVLIMMVTIFGGEIFNNTKVYAKQDSHVEAKVNDAIRLLSDELSKKGTWANFQENIAICKSGVNKIDKEKTIKELFDGSYPSLGTKVGQAIGLMDLDEDPSNYNGKNLVKEIATDLNKEISKLSPKTKFSINETKAMVLLDRYNEKYTDKKVDYNVENAIKYLIADQNSKKSSFYVPQNVAWGLSVFTKHKNIEGSNDAIKKCLGYLHKKQNYSNAGIYGSKAFSIIQHAQVVAILAKLGEKLESAEWTKNGKNPLDALFNSWDGKQFKDDGKKDDYAYYEVLYALEELRDVGYGDYVIKGAKFDLNKEQIKEEPKKTVKVKVRVEANDHTIALLKEIIVDNFDLTPYGGGAIDNVKATHAIIKVLEGVGINCKDKSKFDNYNVIQNIDGLKTFSTGDMDGWMYYVNNTYAPVGVDAYDIKDGDSIVMFFTEDYANTAYSWFDKGEVTVKTGKNLYLNLTGNNYNMFTNESKTSKVFNAKIVVDNEEFVINGKHVTTDKNGDTTLRFDKPGTYTISAVRFNKETNKRDITRPYCKVVVEQGAVSNINKETLEKYINEAQDLVKNATIGNELGKYTQEAVNKLKAEINSANELMKKSEVTQEKIDLEATKLKDLINTRFDTIGNIDLNKVLVSGVSMNKKELELNLEDSIKLNANITPEGASNKSIEWTSSNKEIAVVDENGNVTGLKEGKAVIIVKTQEGDKTAKCSITVRPRKIDQTVKGLKVENITTEKEFKNGNQAKLQFKISNYQDETRNSTLTVGLFDKDGKLVDYVIAEQKIALGKDVILTGSINIPKIGQYKLKAFVWDSLEGMKPLYDVVEILVKQ